MLVLDDQAKAGQVLGELGPADGLGRAGEMPAGVADGDSDGLGADIQPDQLAALGESVGEF
jgi:hypothetical protein